MSYNLLLYCAWMVVLEREKVEEDEWEDHKEERNYEKLYISQV